MVIENWARATNPVVWYYSNLYAFANDVISSRPAGRLNQITSSDPFRHPRILCRR
jgi:hypothetical protein